MDSRCLQKRIRACSLLLHRLSAGIFSNSDTICQKRRVSHETCRRHSDFVGRPAALVMQSSGPPLAEHLARLGKHRQRSRAETRRAVCTRAAAETTAPAKTVISIPGHSCLSIKASRLDGFGPSGQIAVSFEPASPAETIPLIAEAYSLSDREKDIAYRVIRGLSTKAIGDELHISAYTVQDHLKSFF